MDRNALMREGSERGVEFHAHFRDSFFKIYKPN